MSKNPSLFGKFEKLNEMAAPALDNEFLQYWIKLTSDEKESLLNVAKQFVALKNESSDTDDLRKQLVMEERAKYLKEKDQSYSWKQVKQAASETDSGIITILTDETHHRRLMQIDLNELAKDEGILEDLYDLITIELRKDEETISWEEVKKQLDIEDKH